MTDNELILLDACLSDSDALAEITADVTAADFQADEAQKIYGSILKLHRQGLPVDYMSVKKESGQELEFFGNFYFQGFDLQGRIKQLKADAAKARLAEELKRLALQAEKCTLDEAQAALRALNDRQQGTTGPALKVSLTTDWLHVEPPPQEFIFDGVLVKNITGEIHAMGGVGKSFFCNALLLSLCTGADIFDIFKPTKAFKVMHLPAEDTGDIVRRRLYWMAADMADGEREIVQAALDKNLVLIPGQPLPLLELKDGNPVEAEGFRALMALVKQHCPDVLMLDPKSMFCGGLEENGSAPNTAFVCCLKKFNQIGVTVLFSHHESKANGGTGTQTASRGSQALSDGVRWQIALSAMTADDAKKYGVDAEDYVQVKQNKSNYTRFFEPFYLMRGEHGVLDLADLNADRHNEVLNACRQALSAGTTCRQREVSCHAGIPFRQEVKAICGATSRELSRVLPLAIAAGQIKINSQGLLYAA